VTHLEYILETPNTDFIEKLSKESRLINKSDDYASAVFKKFNEFINSDWFSNSINTLSNNVSEGVSLDKQTLKQLYFRKKAYTALKQIIDSEENTNKLFNRESLVKIFNSLNIDFPSEKGIMENRRINSDIKKLLKGLNKENLKKLINDKQAKLDKVITDIHIERSAIGEDDLTHLGKDYEYSPLLGQTLNGSKPAYWRNAGSPINSNQRPEPTPESTRTTSDTPRESQEIDTSKMLDIAMKTAHTALRL